MKKLIVPVLHRSFRKSDALLMTEAVQTASWQMIVPFTINPGKL